MVSGDIRGTLSAALPLSGRFSFVGRPPFPSPSVGPDNIRGANLPSSPSGPYLAEPVKPDLNVRAWFADTVIPLIERELPDLAAEMSIMVEGSFAYGYYDQYSDLESFVV